MKRSEIRRSTPLVARSSLLRGSGLSPVSAKRRKANAERSKALEPLRAAQPWCTRCGATGVGLDAHELLSRARGGSITDLANIRLLCRPCHTLITESPALAESEGWALSQFGGAA